MEYLVDRGRLFGRESDGGVTNLVHPILLNFKRAGAGFLILASGVIA